MREQRRFLRFAKNRTTRYAPQDKIENIQDCTIIDVSRKGMQIVFPEKIDLGAIICLQLPVAASGELAATTVSAQLKWIEKKGNDFIGGIELIETLDDEQFEKLLISYTLSEKKINTSIIKEVINRNKTHAHEKSPPSYSGQPPMSASSTTVFSLTNISRSPLSLALLLALTALFSMISGYCSYTVLNGDSQKNNTVAHRTEAPSSSEATKTFSPQFISPAHAHEADHNKPVVPKKAVLRTAVLQEEGGNLYFLSMKHYQRANETLFDLILQANPSITDVRKIYDDQRITLPVITSESYIKEIADGLFRIHVGTFDNSNVLALYSRKVKRLGEKPLVQAYQCSSKDTWHRLLIDGIPTRKKALKTVNRLIEKNIIYIPPEQKS